MTPRQPSPTLFPYTTLFRSPPFAGAARGVHDLGKLGVRVAPLASLLAPVPPLGTPSASGSAPRTLTLDARSEEHTSELQSHVNLVCRLLLEKKNITTMIIHN